MLFLGFDGFPQVFFVFAVFDFFVPLGFFRFVPRMQYLHTQRSLIPNDRMSCLSIERVLSK